LCDDFMVKTIKKTLPDVVLVGNFHTAEIKRRVRVQKRRSFYGSFTKAYKEVKSSLKDKSPELYKKFSRRREEYFKRAQRFRKRSKPKRVWKKTMNLFSRFKKK